VIGTEVTTADVLDHSHVRMVRAQSWLGDELLADDIPIESGSEEVDRSLRVPERVTFNVPRVADGFDWTPSGAGSPLGADGQRISLQVGVGRRGSDDVEWLQRGWYLLQDARPQDDQVAVTLVGLLTLVDEATLISPFQPNGGIVATIRTLIEPALTVQFDSGLSDRSVPAATNFDLDRLGAVLSLLDAWPAAAAVTPDGFLSVVPDTVSTTPVRTLTDGVDGTLIRASGSATRDGAFQVVVTTGTASDGGTVQGISYVTTGPRAFGGDFNPLGVPYRFSSPLLTTVAQCNAAADTVRRRLQRSTAAAYDVSIVPDPRLQVGDVVQIESSQVGSQLCTIEHLSLPLVADGGEQQLTVRAVVAS
jgi:hypothetical protein